MGQSPYAETEEIFRPRSDMFFNTHRRAEPVCAGVEASFRCRPQCTLVHAIFLLPQGTLPLEPRCTM